jgi:RNA polymerase sigma-70 factor (family 1)
LRINNPHTDNEITSRLAQSDEAAFEQLFFEMHAALCLLANGILHHEETAKDIVADIFLKFWEKKESLSHVKNVKAFLYTSTRNRCLDYLKKQKPESGVEQASLENQWKETSDNHFLQAIYDAETTRQLYRAIESLPPECRKVVELGLEGFSTNEIAEKLGISSSAVSNQKSRAVKLLKAQLPAAVVLVLLSSL